MGCGERITRRELLSRLLAYGVGASLWRLMPAWAAPEEGVQVGYLAQVDDLRARPRDPASSEVAAFGGLIGARAAAEEMTATARLLGRRFALLAVSAPTPEAATHQAKRLVDRGVRILLGGFDFETARAVAEFAQRARILFFNVGTPDGRLRNEACSRYAFHVEASDAQYIDAIADWFIRGLAFLVDEDAPEGVRIIRRRPTRAWFLVTHDAPIWQARRRRMQVALEQRHWGGRIAGDVTVRGGVAFDEVFRAIRAARPDLVLLLLPPARQLDFYRAYDRSGLAFEVTGFPEPVTQTRAFFRALLLAAPRVARGAVRTVLWEPTYKAHGSLQLSNRLLTRWGHPMDGPVWASWFAVKSVWELVLRSGTLDPDRLVEALEKGAVTFDGHKGIALTFRPWDHQLRQPLAMSRLVGLSQDPMELAEAIGTFPNVLAPGRDPNQVLDQLGDRPGETRCRWR